jgi:hypothetical protein
MNWLVIAFVFVPSHGGLGEPRVLYKAFPTEQACNAVGEHFREALSMPVGLESVSVCLDRASFDAADWELIAGSEPTTLG